jgi:hypothetical protein
MTSWWMLLTWGLVIWLPMSHKGVENYNVSRGLKWTCPFNCCHCYKKQMPRLASGPRIVRDRWSRLGLHS